MIHCCACDGSMELQQKTLVKDGEEVAVFIESLCPKCLRKVKDDLDLTQECNKALVKWKQTEEEEVEEWLTILGV